LEKSFSVFPAERGQFSLLQLVCAESNLSGIRLWQRPKKFQVKLRHLVALAEDKLRMPFLRAELQLQFLKERWMVETSAIVRAIQKPVTNQHFDSLGLTFMNSEPLVNGLKGA
jgi:hypothetical protein